MENLKIGSVVCVVGQGIKMTVDHCPLKKCFVKCVWFGKEGQLCRGTFSKEVLQLAIL